MDTVRAYETILDAAFAKHFPGWAEMSPLDPVKVLAEGLASSLGAVEERQRRIVDSALDCLPSLFSVDPKPGRLPVGLFRLRPALRVRETVAFDATATFRFQSPTETLVLTPVRPFRLAPVVDITETREDNTVVLTVPYRGPAATVALAFLPEGGAETARLLDVTVNGLPLAQLTVEDGSDGFTQFGELVVARRDRAPLVGEAGEVVVRLTFGRLPTGRFATNVFPFHFGRRVESLSLGMLRGEAWEEIALPATLPATPESLVVASPDGRERPLERLADEVLRRRRTDFAHGFMSHGARHAVVVPAADVLVGAFNGGVELRTSAAVLFPETAWLHEGFQAVLAEHVTTLEAMTPVAPLLPAVPRETPDAYLARFYAMWRAFRAQQGRTVKPALLAVQLEQELVGADSRLRSVEIAVDTTTSTVTAYCLAEHPAAEAFRLDADLAAGVRARLGASVPIPFQARLSPFCAARVDLAVTLRLVATEERLAALSSDNLGAAVQSASEALLRPPPFGNLRAGVTVEKHELALALRDALTGASGPLKRAELESVDLTLRDESGQFLGVLSRQPGECLRAVAATKVDLRLAREAAHA